MTTTTRLLEFKKNVDKLFALAPPGMDWHFPVGLGMTVDPRELSAALMWNYVDQLLDENPRLAYIKSKQCTIFDLRNLLDDAMLVGLIDRLWPKEVDIDKEKKAMVYARNIYLLLRG